MRRAWNVGAKVNTRGRRNISDCRGTQKSPSRKWRTPKRYRRKLRNAANSQLINVKSRMVEASDGPVYTMNNIFDVTLRNKHSRKTRDNKILAFQKWMREEKEKGARILTVPQMKQMEHRLIVSTMVERYFEYRFNMTYNTGNTFETDMQAILSFFRSNGIHLTKKDFPWFGPFKRGCNVIAKEVFDKNVGDKKLAIFHPMLEAMLPFVNSTDVQLALLLAHRFCLRAQHYVHTTSDADILTLGQIRFQYNDDGSVHSMTIGNRNDKNHRHTHEMERTVYCSCATEWTCLPCYADACIAMKKDGGATSASVLISKNGEAMTYEMMAKEVKRLMTAIGVNPNSYGTHSLRAGGITELYLSGLSILELRNFGWWKTCDTVVQYVRPHNPDMKKFVPDFAAYCERRKGVNFVSNNKILMTWLKQQRGQKRRSNS